MPALAACGRVQQLLCLWDRVSGRCGCRRGLWLTYSHHIPAQKEDGHHGEAIIQVQLRVCSAQGVQAPARKHERRAALPHEEHATCTKPSRSAPWRCKSIPCERNRLPTSDTSSSAGCSTCNSPADATDSGHQVGCHRLEMSSRNSAGMAVAFVTGNAKISRQERCHAYHECFDA